MVFLKRLDTPITLQAAQRKSACATTALREHGAAEHIFRCDAYDDHNSVYVLENNGLKLFNSNNTELLKGQNVYTVLSQMSLPARFVLSAGKGRAAKRTASATPTPFWTAPVFYSLKQMKKRCMDAGVSGFRQMMSPPTRKSW